jgi:alkylation response protein AidB-like acyl-CoA dehydrogenase
VPWRAVPERREYDEAARSPLEDSMDFRFSAEDEAFRDEVRQWIRSEFPPDYKGYSRFAPEGEGFEEMRSVQRKLAKQGWTAPAWPQEWGGMGASFTRQAVFNEELAYNRIPGPDLVAVGYVGPTIMLYGSEKHKQEFLPRIVNADIVWCQGYSEPGSGSDLASLQTRAVKDGDDYVINGQKIWTSGGHHADWMFMLARTDPAAPKHKGISYFLLDMKTPGITVRPLINLANHHGFNEVFFEDVRVPAENMIGEENRGWYIGMATLDFERSAIAGSAGIRRTLEDLIEVVHSSGTNGAGTSGRGAAKTALADAWLAVEVARMLSLQVLSMQQRGRVPNHEASVAKVFSSELNQRVARLGVSTLSLYGQLCPDSKHAKLGGAFADSYMETLASTIAGGTSEIQRNIIASRGLGLPRS